MDIQLLSKNKDKISFLIKGTNHAYVNTLRRLMSAEVPVLAIEDVSFIKNNSILYDEMVAHRLGLVSLKTDSGMDEKSEVKFTLKAKGPGYVYASDLKTTDKKCKAVFPKTPIVKLLDKQEMQLDATAIMGRGLEHVKWSPGTMFSVEEPKLNINNKSADFEKFKDKYPEAAFNKKGELDEKEILKNNLVDACDGVNDEILSVEYNNENFIFNVETWGQLSCDEIVKGAVDQFNERLTELAKLLKAK